MIIIEKYLQALPADSGGVKIKKLSHARLLQANKDSRLAAKAANLVYVSVSQQGIVRRKKGKGFVYFYNNKMVRDKKQLERIRKLAIPPAWKDVWICNSPHGHIQATGFDVRNRKQYRYHASWNQLRNETKFHHLYEFGKLLPRLRRKIQRDIRSKKLTQEKVLAAAINLMEKTYIRLGNENYEKENGSYGLATLKDRHVTVKQDKLTVSFTGKKGVQQRISLKNKKLARIIKQCRDIPGKPLFQYYDDNNERRAIDSMMLNNYIKQATDSIFSAKDIRTWAGSVQAIEYLMDQCPDATPGNKSVNAMLDWVSAKLGNTRNVCKKYYVHPALISFCEKKLELASLKFPSAITRTFSKSEELLMALLKANQNLA